MHCLKNECQCPINQAQCLKKRLEYPFSTKFESLSETKMSQKASPMSQKSICGKSANAILLISPILLSACRRRCGPHSGHKAIRGFEFCLPL